MQLEANQQQMRTNIKFTATLLRTEFKRNSTFPFLKYTEYQIKICQNQNEWFISKRYKDFSRLNKKLKSFDISIDQFPKKRLFPNRKEVIQERSKKLILYLNNLLEKLGQNIFSIKYNLVKTFIEFEEQRLHCLTTLTSNKVGNFLSRSLSEKKNFNNCTKIVITDFFSIEKKYNSGKKLFESPSLILSNFLNKMNNECSSLTNNLMLLERFLKENNFKLSTNDIELLLLGDKENKGLIHFAGEIHNNRYGAIKCLDLILRILDIEVNPSFEKYLKVFRRATTKQLKSLDIKVNIKDCNMEYAFKCLRLIELWYEKNNIDISYDRLIRNLYNLDIKSIEICSLRNLNHDTSTVFNETFETI